MAPRGARGESSRASRDTRNSSRTTSRGGIQKKRGGPTRTDGDGDLTMDSAATRGTRSRPGPRSAATANTRGTSKTAQAVVRHLNNNEPRSSRSRGLNSGLTYLQVRGLRQSKAASNPDGGVKDLIAFLERKASRVNRKVIIRKHHVAGEYVLIGVTKEDSEEVLRQTWQFAGVDLDIQVHSGDVNPPSKATLSKETEELRSKLQTILSQRYLGDNRLLKLDALATDPDLVALGMFATRERALKTFKGLMAICDGLFKTAKEKQAAINSISLANNSIDDVVQVEMVATTFPQLENLDMSGNQIANMKGLERWKGRFKALDTILTTGNPIETTDPNFQASLLAMFPKLRNINGVEVRTAEQIAQQAEAKRPKPIPQNGPDFRDVNAIGENFLLEFFPSFDSKRRDLAMSLYDENSLFSLAVDATSVRDPNLPAPLPWSSYIKVSRNLLKITTPNARIQRLFTGGNVIADLWDTIPFTRHPDIKAHTNKYIMDCHPLSGIADPTNQSQGGVDGLVICVHGEYDEHDQKTGTTGKRSFSRTFVLGPGQPGRAPIRVVSDMLSLRAYSPLPDVFAQQAPTLADPTHAQHQAMIVELSRQTGMVAEYSELCLVEVGWDFENALILFKERRDKLPPVAFATMPQ